eukprot:2628455-Amphidinium_carterae.1
MHKRPAFAGLVTGLIAIRLSDTLRNVPLERMSAPARPLLLLLEAEPEDLSHILYRRPHWRRDVQLPADDDTIPPCVKLHGILPAPRVALVITHEPVLVYRTG